MPQESTDPPSPKDQTYGVGRCSEGYGCDILKEKPMHLHRIWSIFWLKYREWRWSGLCVGCFDVGLCIVCSEKEIGYE
jgi:hypothetical protein